MHFKWKFKDIMTARNDKNSLLLAATYPYFDRVHHRDLWAKLKHDCLESKVEDSPPVTQGIQFDPKRFMPCLLKLGKKEAPAWETAFEMQAQIKKWNEAKECKFKDLLWYAVWIKRNETSGLESYVQAVAAKAWSLLMYQPQRATWA